MVERTGSQASAMVAPTAVLTVEALGFAVAVTMEEQTAAPMAEQTAEQMAAPLAEYSVLARLIAVGRDRFVDQYWGQ
ncbi:MAG TPA: hypothetical protein VI030_12825, partial [Propionibacteriaceae bacterium]